MIWMNSDFITVLKSWFPVRFLHGFSQPWLANLPPCSMWKVVSPSHLQVVLPPFWKHILWLSSAEGCMRQPPKGFPPTGIHMLRTWQRQVSSLTNRNTCHANWKYFNFAFHSSRYFINPVCPNCKYFWIPSSDGNSDCHPEEEMPAHLSHHSQVHPSWLWWCASLLWPPVFQNNTTCLVCKEHFHKHCALLLCSEAMTHYLGWQVLQGDKALALWTRR